MSERVLGVARDLPFVPKPNELVTALTDALPPPELVTGAFAFAFDGDRMLMTELREAARGWDLPGGGVEAGETPEEAARREVYEETGARLGPLEPFAYQQVRILCPKPDGYRFPHPNSYMVFFWGRVAALDPFAPTEEARWRELLEPDQVRQTRWGGSSLPLYEAALERARRDEL